MTIEQKQCLLRYLGYYMGNIDGMWGDKSQNATKNFQEAYGLTVDGIAGEKTQKALLGAVAGTMEPITSGHPPDTGTFWDEIKYFSRSEFRCPCGRCGGFPAEPKEKLVRVADRVRKHFGKAATVSSGVRCTAHNAELSGSVSNSRHLSGKAMDFSITGVSGATLKAFIDKQSEIRYSYVIEGNWVHMDID